MDHPPPLPATREEALLRGPLILTAISRVLLIPFYLLCAWRASGDAWRLLPYFKRHSLQYLADKFLLVGSMWMLALQSVLLAWLFFSRRQAFRPMMVYFCCLFVLLMVCLVMHFNHFPGPHRQATTLAPEEEWGPIGLLLFVLSGLLWPFYYAFSPRMKRVFTH